MTDQAEAGPCDCECEALNAAQDLAREVSGCWRVYEVGLREVMGHTNYNVIARKLGNLDACLKTHHSAEKEVNELRAALEPFARNVDAVLLREALGHVTREHLRAARRALEGEMSADWICSQCGEWHSDHAGARVRAALSRADPVPEPEPPKHNYRELKELFKRDK